MKMVVIASGCLWPILLNTVEGVRGRRRGAAATPPVLPARPGSRGCGTWCCAARARRSSTGARQALSIGIILMVISEMFAASNGLGFAIVQFQRSFAIPEMWSGVILLGLIGVAAVPALPARRATGSSPGTTGYRAAHERR